MISLKGHRIVDLTWELVSRVTRMDQTIEEVCIEISICVLILIVIGIFGFLYLAHTGRIS